MDNYRVNLTQSKKVKLLHKWFTYDDLKWEYVTIIADPLKDKELEKYNYIILFDPQNLNKYTYYKEDLTDLAHKGDKLLPLNSNPEQEDQDIDNYEEEKDFNVIEFLKNLILKLNISYKDINALRRFLPNNSYNEELKKKKLLEMNEDLLHSLRLLSFKVDIKDSYYKDFKFLNRFFNKKAPSFGFFTKMGEDSALHEFENLRLFSILLPPNPQYVDIDHFYRTLLTPTNSYSLIDPLRVIHIITRGQDIIPKDDIIGRIERVIRKLEDIPKNVLIKIEREAIYEKHYREYTNYLWEQATTPLINAILRDFDITYARLASYYPFLKVNPHDAFTNFILDVLTPENLKLLAPGIDQDLFKEILIKKYLNYFFKPQIDQYVRTIVQIDERFYLAAFEEVIKEVGFLKKRNLTVHLTPSETLEDLLIDFRIKFTDLNYVIKRLQNVPTKEYRKDANFIKENFEVFDRLIDNPFKEVDETDFFESIAEEGHLTPIINEFIPIKSDEDNSKKDNNTAVGDDKIEKTDDYLDKVSNFVFINLINKPPLASEICNTSIRVPMNKKIRIYKIYVGFLYKDLKNKCPRHVFTNPMLINVVVDTVDGFNKTLENEIYAAASKIEDLKSVIGITTYVYYIGNQDLVGEAYRRSFILLIKEIGYHWLGIGSDKVIAKKPKVFVYFAFFLFSIFYLSSSNLTFVFNV